MIDNDLISRSNKLHINFIIKVKSEKSKYIYYVIVSFGFNTFQV